MFHDVNLELPYLVTNGVRRKDHLLAETEKNLLVVSSLGYEASFNLHERLGEEAFQKLRSEYDKVLMDSINRGNAGRVIRLTWNGMLALFSDPSLAVERAIDVQIKLYWHPHVKVRIGIDMGLVLIDPEGDARSIYGRPVRCSARIMNMADGGHILVTADVRRNTSLPRIDVTWKYHGSHKSGEATLELFEPYNKNIATPMERLNGNNGKNIWLKLASSLLDHFLRLKKDLHLYERSLRFLLQLILTKPRLHGTGERINEAGEIQQL